jgi:hypothetical protein
MSSYHYRVLFTRTISFTKDIFQPLLRHEISIKNKPGLVEGKSVHYFRCSIGMSFGRDGFYTATDIKSSLNIASTR